MQANVSERASARERLSRNWDALRSSFGFLSGVAMLLGLLLGFGLPALDAALDVDLPAFDFDSQDAGRGLLETVATTTVAVAGLSFSVTVVAFTLAASQLSPRVLRTFRADRLSQATLALFLGTFIYCLTVLVRLGASDAAEPVPNLSITVAIILAFAAFALFAAFIAHIMRMLQPSSIIEDIRGAADGALSPPYPSGVGDEPSDPAAAERAVDARCAREAGTLVRTDDEGYLTNLNVGVVLAAAMDHDGLVVQRIEMGDYVARGTVVAEVWGDDPEGLADAVRGAFVTGIQRTPVQDPAFPVRQLADVALKGLSPGINDPTTAENAMDALAAVLTRAAAGDWPSRHRASEDGEVRFVARPPGLDDLVRLGFEQVRVFAAPYPVVSQRLLTLLGRIEDEAERNGMECTEPARQAALIAEGAGDDLPTVSDAVAVRQAQARRW